MSRFTKPQDQDFSAEISCLKFVHNLTQSKFMLIFFSLSNLHILNIFSHIGI